MFTLPVATQVGIVFQLAAFTVAQNNKDCYSNQFSRLDSKVRSFLNSNTQQQPLQSNTGPVNMTVSLYISALVEVDERANTFTILGGLEMHQHYFNKSDELSWIAAENCNITKLEIRNSDQAGQFWKPLIVSNYIVSNKAIYPTVVYIRNVGMVSTDLWGFTRVTFKCSYDMTYYPFDIHVCEFTIALKIYKGQQTRVDDVMCYFSQYSSIHPLWTAITCDGKRIYRSGHAVYADFRVVLRRSSSYELVAHLTPAATIANANSLIFVVPPNHPGKLTVGMGFILALLLVFYCMIIELPRTTAWPIFLIYMIAVIITSCVSVGIAAYLPQLKNGRRAKRINTICLLVMLIVEFGLTVTLFAVLYTAPSIHCVGNSCTYKEHTVASRIPPNTDT